jgi:hypothetical protein
LEDLVHPGDEILFKERENDRIADQFLMIQFLHGIERLLGHNIAFGQLRNKVLKILQEESQDVEPGCRGIELLEMGEGLGSITLQEALDNKFLEVEEILVFFKVQLLEMTDDPGDGLDKGIDIKIVISQIAGGIFKGQVLKVRRGEEGFDTIKPELQLKEVEHHLFLVDAADPALENVIPLLFG